MQKYKWLLILMLISCTVTFFACDRAQQMLETVLPDPEPVTPPEMVEDDPIDTSVLQNRLTVEGATAVSAKLPETSTAETAPRIQADVGEINTSPGGTVSLPFAYSGANNLSGCIVCIEGVDGYFDLPYIGAPDDLPSAISVSLPQNVALGSFTVCYSVYDDQGQYGNFITVIINVTEPEMVEPEPPEIVIPELPMRTGGVMIYTGATWWSNQSDVADEAEVTRSLLQAKGIQVEVTEDENGDGDVNILITYSVIPNSIYSTGNTQPDGSVAENWIETTDGDTILNHFNYFGYSGTHDQSDQVDLVLGPVLPHANREGGLRNLMDNSDINLIAPIPFTSMIVTSDGRALTPSLANFESNRAIPLNQLRGEWFAEKIFASDTRDAQATYADPVIVRDGNRGRLAIVHATPFGRNKDLLNGEVAAEIIINYLLAE